MKKQSFNEVFGPFRLPVDRIFAMKGFGAVITGTSISGRTTIGEDLRFYPSELTAKVRGIQVHSSSVDDVEAGHRTAINLQGVDTAYVERGMVVATPDTLEPNYMLDCDFLYLRSNSKALKHRSRIRVHLGTAEVIGRISLLDRDELYPGDEVGVQLLLESPVAVWPGDRYVIRSYSPVTTIGGGEILCNVSPKKRKRLSEKDREYNQIMTETLKSGSFEEKTVFLLEESGGNGLTFDELGIRLGLFSKHLKKALADPLSNKQILIVDSASQRYVAKKTTDEVEKVVVEGLQKYHAENPLQNGLSKEELRSGISRQINTKVFNYVLNVLLKGNVIVQEDSIIRMEGHQVALKADEEKLQRDLESWFKEKGLFTPTMKETLAHFADYSENLVKEVIDLLIREEKIIKVSETLYFDSAILQKLIQDVQEFIIREGEIDPPGFKELSGLTRKFSIPILEYFDRIKLTIRVGDKRVLRKKM